MTDVPASDPQLPVEIEAPSLQPAARARALNAAWDRVHGARRAQGDDGTAPVAADQLALAQAWRTTHRPALALAALGWPAAVAGGPSGARPVGAADTLTLTIDAVAQLYLLGWSDWAQQTWAAALQSVQKAQRAGTLRRAAARWLDLHVAPDRIEPLLREALKADPRDGQAVGLLGQVMQRMGQHSVALTHLNLALDAAPDDAQVLTASAMSLLEVGRLEGGAQRAERACELAPQMAAAWLAKGRAAFKRSDYRGAAPAFERAWSLGPADGRFLSDLGVAWLQLGHAQRAEAWLRLALAHHPEEPMAHNGLAMLLITEDRLDEADRLLSQALGRFPEHPILRLNRAVVFIQRLELLDAHTELTALLKLNPHHAAVLRAMAGLLSSLQDFVGAMQCHERGLHLEPDDPIGWANMLFCANYHPLASAADIRRRYADYDKHVRQKLRLAGALVTAPPSVPLQGRRLRVGYMSPDFRRHSVRHFLLPLIAHHDRQRVEVFAYAELWQADEFSTQYQQHVDHWIRVQEMSDEALAQRIRDDHIDVLVDVAGHTSGSRLNVFARKPAPLQVTWMGYGSTTGLSAMVAYRPTVGMGDCGPLPARRNGHVRFGSLSRIVRLNDKVIALWATLLKAVPASRLVLNVAHFSDARTRAWMTERFAGHGIRADRLDMGYTSPPWDVLRNIDITLDCFPHNSGTTLIESLYMGVPFVTLKDRPSVGLLGASINHSAGLDDWTAATPDEYLRIACHWADHLDDLAALRGQLRARMQASALMDEPGFARDVEDAFFAMHQKALQKK
jgi:protein O-GlcNAc transferase